MTTSIHDLPNHLVMDLYYILMQDMKSIQNAWLLSITCKRFKSLADKTHDPSSPKDKYTTPVSIATRWKNERISQRKALIEIISNNVADKSFSLQKLHHMPLNQLLHIMYDPIHTTDYFQSKDPSQRRVIIFKGYPICRCGSAHVFSHDCYSSIVTYDHFTCMNDMWTPWKFKVTSSDVVAVVGCVKWVDEKFKSDTNGWRPMFFRANRDCGITLNEETGGKDIVSGIESPDIIVRQCAENAANHPYTSDVLVKDDLIRYIESRFEPAAPFSDSCALELKKCYSRSVLSAYDVTCESAEEYDSRDAHLYFGNAQHSDVYDDDDRTSPREIQLVEYLFLHPTEDHLEVPLERETMQDTLYNRLIRFTDSINKALQERESRESPNSTLFESVKM